MTAGRRGSYRLDRNAPRAQTSRSRSATTRATTTPRRRSSASSSARTCPTSTTRTSSPTSSTSPATWTSTCTLGSWLTLRGGVRQEYFNYNVLNLCALPVQYVPATAAARTWSAAALDPDGRRRGCRTSAPRATALVTEPKVHRPLRAPTGFHRHRQLPAVGAQSLRTPPTSARTSRPLSRLCSAGEAGVLYHSDSSRPLQSSARALYYHTHVGQDLMFNPDLGGCARRRHHPRRGPWPLRGSPAAGSTSSASFTYAYATLRRRRHARALRARTSSPARTPPSSDGFPGRVADHPLTGTRGLGLSFVGYRARLPLGQTASPTFVVRRPAALRWSFLKLSLNRAEPPQLAVPR